MNPKRIFTSITTIVVMALAIAALGVSPALAEGGGNNPPPPPPSPEFCVNGMPVPAVLEFEGGSATLGKGLAALIITNFGGVFYLGFEKGTDNVIFLNGSLDPDEWLEPGWSGPWVVSEGACPPSGPGKKVVPASPPNLPACYSQHQIDPGYWPNAVAKDLYKQGYWRPYAVASPVSNTSLGNGYYLTCRLDGRTVVNGAAISSGIGGQVWDSTGIIPGAVPQLPKDVNYVLTDPARMGEFVQIAR